MQRWGQLLDERIEDIRSIWRQTAGGIFHAEMKGDEVTRFELVHVNYMYYTTMPISFRPPRIYRT